MKLSQLAGAALIVNIAGLQSAAAAEWRFCIAPAGQEHKIYMTAPLLTVSLDGELGYGNRDPGSYISGYVGAPIALVARGSGMQFVPFITPGFGFAHMACAPG